MAAGAVVLAGAASLTFAAASAHGTGGQPAANRQVIEDLAFHQVNQLPILAADYKTGSCRGIPAGDDGWHFVFPDGVFVSVTAHFLVDGEVIVKVPLIRSDNPKQADVATPAGAKLVAASARGIFDTPGSHGNHESFNLSNTCPAGAPPVEPTEEPTTEPTECCPCTEEPSVNVTTEPETEEPTTPVPTTVPPTGTAEPTAPAPTTAPPPTTTPPTEAQEPTTPVTPPASPGQPAPTPSPVSTCFSVTG